MARGRSFLPVPPVDETLIAGSISNCSKVVIQCVRHIHVYSISPYTDLWSVVLGPFCLECCLLAKHTILYHSSSNSWWCYTIPVFEHPKLYIHVSVDYKCLPALATYSNQAMRHIVTFSTEVNRVFFTQYSCIIYTIPVFEHPKLYTPAV